VPIKSGLDLFLAILNEVTLPIVLVAALGYIMQLRLRFDVSSFNRLQVYVVLPCFLIYYLSSAVIPLSQVSVTAWFTVAQFLVLVAFGWAASAMLHMPQSTRPVLGLSATFANSGNFGIPVVMLAFGKDYVLHQAVIVSIHSILITSLGVILISRKQTGWLGSIKKALSTPVLPAVICGILLKFFEVRLPIAIAMPIQIMGSAYTPLALFALGAQLAISKWTITPRILTLGLCLRLVVAPAATWIAVSLLDLPRGLADMLIVTASAPAGVLLAIICAEYRVHEDLARIIHEKCAIKAKPLISFTAMRMGCLMKFFAMKSLAQGSGGLGRFGAV